MGAVTVGLQVDYMARHLQDEPPFAHRALDLALLLFFIVEAGLRLYVYRMAFFSMFGWLWNVTDLVFIILQVIEELMLIVARILGNKDPVGKDVMPTTLFRIVRVIRAVRVIRVLRVMRFMEDLQLLVSCILHSVKAFAWSLALLLLMVYVMGIYVTQLCIVHRLNAPRETEEFQELTKWFGTVPTSSLSMFQAVTAGIDYNDIIFPLNEYVSFWAALFAMVFISFTLIAVMNIVTGTFVSSALERADEVNSMRKVMQARRVFKSLDLDFSGHITVEEVEHHLENPEVQAYFKSIDVDPSEARGLFKLLDADGSGRIEFNEFLEICLRLQGNAKAVDLLVVARETIDSVSRNAAVLQRIETQIQTLATSPLKSKSAIETIPLS